MRYFDKMVEEAKATQLDTLDFEIRFYDELKDLKKKYLKKLKERVKQMNNIVYFDDLKKEKERFMYEF